MSQADLRRLVPEATEDIGMLLASGRIAVDPPIRSEIFGRERFAQHGRSLGHSHTARGPSPLRSDPFFPRLRDNIQTLREARAYISAQAQTGYQVSPAAEWLLDNFHLIEAQLDEFRDGLPRRYFQGLPVLVDEPLGGLPRIYGVAWAFVAHTDGAFDEELLEHFLSAYQQARQLTLAELWALPTTLRVVLIESLRRLAERLATNMAAREIANIVCDRAEVTSTDSLDELLGLLNRRGVGRTFLVQMTLRLQDQLSTRPAPFRQWLSTVLPDQETAQVEQPIEQAADNLSVSNAIGSLRRIRDADWPEIVSHTSPTIQLLLRSVSFESERGDTRDATLQATELLARRSGQNEFQIAETLLHLMNGDAGSNVEATTFASHWLQGPGRPELLRRLGLLGSAFHRWEIWRHQLALPLYLATLIGTTLALVTFLLWRYAAVPAGVNGLSWLSLVTAVLMGFPASEAVVAVLNRLISETALPTRLPRLALVHGIPPGHRVIVVIPSMLSSREAAAELARSLELHFIANPERHAQFALLTDWPDADSRSLDADAAVLEAAVGEIAALNARHPADAGLAPRFILLHRERSYNETQRRWIGWERKRGKLEQLVTRLAVPLHEATAASPFIDLGEASRLAPDIRYVVTLDGDTQLPPGRLHDLVGVAAHPYNQPVVDTRTRTVIRGYGILQPRVATPLPTAKDRTLYHWLFAGQNGIDPYSAATSELYQDVFSEGTFTGKGLLNVEAMQAVLSNRLPEDRVLSHDLLEGSLARCAAVTDITLIEDAPFHADVAASRTHRWIRGDWQLLPFMANPGAWGIRGIRAINRWKMIDNLRRSLVAPMSLALVLVALASSVVSVLTALGLVASAFAAGPLMGAIAGFWPSRQRIAKLRFYREAGVDLLRAIAIGVWSVSQLLHLALVSVDAIARTLWRISVSRRHLLEWKTAASAQAAASTDLRVIARRQMAVLTLAAGLWVCMLAFGAPGKAALGSLFCALWAASPVWTWWVSRARPLPGTGLSGADKPYLEGTARDTWRLFERCVGADENHLPPDNLQLTPQTMVAHRTSPTNIGLYLLSAACARQFGWIGTQDLIDRLEATLQTLDQLPRHRGHFLNWYDTQSKAALLPMYVSTVDSGNLSGQLLAVAQALRQLRQAPHDPNPARRALQASAVRLASMSPSAQSMGGALSRILTWVDPIDFAGQAPGEAEAQLRAAAYELDALLSDDQAALAPDAASEFAWHASDHIATLRSALRDVLASGPRVASSSSSAPSTALETAFDKIEADPTWVRLEAVADRCRTLAWEADYAFLYHRKRQLFHIGYRVADQQLDTSFYDLLASESRLTSLLAIAKGDAPVNHWAALGRPFYAIGVHAGLRSWSGSMFEYLMPTLMLDEPRGSVLHDAGRAAVLEQIAFGREQHAPWGVSESAYAARDHSLAYQYAPQGVPRLALRRTPLDELVVAPYATALGAQIAPDLAVENLHRLQKSGARARYGFVEALDYTAARQTDANGFVRVDTFMAHHQGMTIVALANVLLDGTPRRWAMADAHIQAVASLLHERVPREIPVLLKPPPGDTVQTGQRRAPGMLREVPPGSAALTPTHLLSNGRYSVALRANGAGWSRWGDVGIARSRDDALRDAHGSFFYLRWDRQPRAVSLTQHPAPDAAAHYHSTYHADRVCFDAYWSEVEAHMTVWISPEDDIEFRQVELRNLSERALDLELMSAFEVTLADPRSDDAHPAFSNLFLRSHWRAAQQAMVFERKPRLPTERSFEAAHFLAETDPAVIALRIQPKRLEWLGRNRDPSHPLARFENPPAVVESEPVSATQALDTGLDPMCGLSARIKLAPHSSIRLTFCTAASDSRATLDAVIDKYRQPGPIQRASLMSATLNGIRLRDINISADNFAAIQNLTTALVLNVTRPRAAEAAFDDAPAPACDRRVLWRFGISGDRPIVLVSAGAPQGLGLLRAFTQGLRIWAWAGVACDLVVVNVEPTSYLMALQRDVSALRDQFMAQNTGSAGSANCSFHVLRAEELSELELTTLHTLARVHFNADGRPLSHHVSEWSEQHELALLDRQATSSTALPVITAAGAESRVPEGRFMAGSGEFHFNVGVFQRPARPWVNVLANPSFGAQISEAGGGYTWALNSRLNQLTPWSNDPVADPPGEWLMLQDLRTNELWNVTPTASGDGSVVYRIAHGQGYSIISHRRGDLDISAAWCVDATTSVKQMRLRIVNRGHRTQRLRAIGIAEWVMGGSRGDRATTSTAAFSQSASDQRLSAGAAAVADVASRRIITLTCTQRDRSAGFGEGTAFLALATHPDDAPDWTCDRRECFDARGRLAIPDYFGRISGSGLDPCAALSTQIVLAAGDEAECVFLLGFGTNLAQARRLALEAAAMPAVQRMDLARESWDALLGASTVETPDPLFDAMVNRWLLYQTVACRLWARAGFYQAGGAFGFRDQLQDAMALAWASPRLLREQIVLNASRQFPEGDVQHWWHAPTGAGVRTHFSDDLLWLAYACVHYLQCTGDTTLLDERVAFIDGAEIPAGAEDAYYVPVPSGLAATVFEHAARAIDRSSQRVGLHGLPLMGTGDWNDGMNRVGSEGRGESVWLAWFLCSLVDDFAPLARARGEADRAQRWEAASQGWRLALEGAAWDGEWFKRAFFDDGSPLGSHVNAECRIDLIAQAWSVISGAAPAPLQRQALHAMQEHLVDEPAGLLKLLTPPLQTAEPTAGYIQAYPPGVRENGGQYSHAGVWALIAQAMSGDGDAAYRYFTFLSPAHRSTHVDRRDAYEIEPYVMAGDVYSEPPYVGRGGWSWYTGSAAWMHRAATEHIFGMRVRGSSISFVPCLPSHWEQASITLRRNERRFRVVFCKASATAAWDAAHRAGAVERHIGQTWCWDAADAPETVVIRFGWSLVAQSEPTGSAPPQA